MNLRSQLLDMKNTYCSATGLAASTVARRAANDGKFFDRIEGGGGFTAKTYETVMQWFNDNMPVKPNGHRKKKT